MKPRPSQRIRLGELEGGQPLSLDLPRLVDSRLLIQANSGGGKSWLFRLIAEQVGGKVPLIILDPEGEFATLRERVDLVLVGPDGEIPAEPRTAGLLARKLVELQVSAVIDLFDLDWDSRRHYIRQFLEALLGLPRTLWHPLLVMIDEAQMFAPERSHGDAESTGAVVSLMAQGRKRGYAGLLATQRLSKLHKDAAAEANNVFIGRTWLDTDQKRAGDLLGLAARDRSQLRDVPEGTFYAFGPALSVSGVIKFRSGAVTTTHPQPGRRHALKPPKASEAIKQIARHLADLPKQAEQEIRDLAAAQRRVKDLEIELRKLKSFAPVTVEPTIKVKEIPVLRDSQIKRLEALVEKASSLEDRVRALAGTIGTEVARLASAIASVHRPGLVPVPAPERRAEVCALSTTPGSAARPRAVSVASKAPSMAGDARLPEGERRIMTAVGQHRDGVSREQLTVLTGYRRSSRDAYIQRLKGRGLVEVGPDRVVITGAGLGALGPDFEPLPTGQALRGYWVAHLPGGERRILEVLVARYPGSVERTALDEAIGYKRSSRDAYLQRLKVRQLIELVGRGAVRASPVLFK